MGISCCLQPGLAALTNTDNDCNMHRWISLICSPGQILVLWCHYQLWHRVVGKVRSQLPASSLSDQSFTVKFESGSHCTSEISSTASECILQRSKVRSIWSKLPVNRTPDSMLVYRLLNRLLHSTGWATSHLVSMPPIRIRQSFSRCDFSCCIFEASSDKVDLCCHMTKHDAEIASEGMCMCLLAGNQGQ